MSRIGRKPIPIPKGVTTQLDGTRITVKGPKGEISRLVHAELAVAVEGETIVVRRLHGNPRPVELSGYALGNGDWLPADARHGPASLPDHREQLAADAGGARFAVRHEPLRRREDRHPEAVLDAGDLTRLDVAAQPRRG